jgi:hypothetical protein
MSKSSNHPFNHHLLQEFITPVLDGKSFAHLEELFNIVSSLKPTFPKFIQTLLETDIWKKNAAQLPYFPIICQKLSQTIDDSYNNSYKEPPYHSRQHFMDVCLATHLFVLQNNSLALSEKSPWWLSPLECWYLFISAIAHDYGHNGMMNLSIHQQELHSIELLNIFLDKTSFPDKEQCKVITRTLIIATDPKDRASLVKRAESNQQVNASDKLSMLLVEADLFASSLPIKGVELGRRLSEEFIKQDARLAASITTNEGRLGFLNTVSFISEQSQLLNAPQVLQEAILMTQS